SSAQLLVPCHCDGNYPSTYSLSLHDALPIWALPPRRRSPRRSPGWPYRRLRACRSWPGSAVLRARDARAEQGAEGAVGQAAEGGDRKSTRLNSSHSQISYAVFCMKKKTQTAGQSFTNVHMKEMTRKVSAEVDLVHQHTQNQRYGSSHIGAYAKDISIVVIDAAAAV